MLITSRTFSTTHIVLWSRLPSLHIAHSSSSDIIMQVRQYFTFSLRFLMESVKCRTLSTGWRSRCNASLRALFSPTPGSELMASTACSRSSEGYFSLRILVASIIGIHSLADRTIFEEQPLGKFIILNTGLTHNHT